MTDKALTLGPPNKAHWDQEAGRVAYEAFVRANGWKFARTFLMLRAEEQTAWCLAAAAVLALVPGGGAKP